MHSTNYRNAFIEAADDSKRVLGTVPPEKDPKTVARLEYEILRDHPYEYSSDDLLFLVHASRNGIRKAEWKKAREEFFSKPMACLRASPLCKGYGWGIHHDADSKVALYGMETEAYARLRIDASLEHYRAMRNSR